MTPTFGKVIRYTDPRTGEDAQGMVIGEEAEGQPNLIVVSPDNGQEGTNVIIETDMVLEIIG